LFIEVTDDKLVKNRVHLDLVPTDRRRDVEVDRVLALGASQVADLRRPDGSGRVTLADPEGNEFCMVRSNAERATAAGSSRSLSSGELPND
jgi:Glyoxalase-like domain